MIHYGITHGGEYNTYNDLIGCTRYIIDTYGIHISRYMEIYNKLELALKPTGKFKDDDLGLTIVRYNYGIKYP